MGEFAVCATSNAWQHTGRVYHLPLPSAPSHRSTESTTSGRHCDASCVMQCVSTGAAGPHCLGPPACPTPHHGFVKVPTSLTECNVPNVNNQLFSLLSPHSSVHWCVRARVCAAPNDGHVRRSIYHCKIAICSCSFGWVVHVLCDLQFHQH